MVKFLYFNFGEVQSVSQRENVKWLVDLCNNNIKLKQFCSVKSSIKIVSDFICRSNQDLNPFPRYLTHQQLMPKFVPSFNKRLETICDERAKEIEQLVLNSNKRIRVLWSGGIDSTTVLVSFLKNFDKKTLELVDVSLDFQSICENPLFYQNYIHNKLRVVDNKWKYKNFGYSTSSDFLFVDGEPGDFLFGSEFCLNKFMPRYGTSVYQPWRNNINKIKEVVGLDWLVDQTIDNIESSSIPINTTMDFFWWINFDNRWAVKTFVKILNYIEYDDIDSKNIKGVLSNGLNFFNTVDFQKWSMLKEFIDPNPIRFHSDYKMPLKKYIYEFDKNHNYMMLKTKVNSNMLFPVYNIKKPLAIITDGEKMLSFNTETIDELKKYF